MNEIERDRGGKIVGRNNGYGGNTTYYGTQNHHKTTYVQPTNNAYNCQSNEVN